MAEGWFVINHSLLNSTLYSQRFSFFDDSECRLYPLCKEWSQVFSLHPCDSEFMFLSCWCCLRTESSFSKAEDLASQIGCYWHGPKLDWWQSPCDRHPPSSIPISRTKSLMDYQRGDLHDYRQYIQYQSLSIRSDQNVPEAKKHETFQSAESYVQILLGQNTWNKGERCINHSCNIKAESTVSRQKCLVWKNVFTSLLRTCLCDLKFQTVTKYVQPSLSENHSGWA